MIPVAVKDVTPLPYLNTSLNSMGVTANDNDISLSLELSFANPYPISINLGFGTAAFSLKDEKDENLILANIFWNGFELTREGHVTVFSSVIKISRQDSAKDLVSDFVRRLVADKGFAIHTSPLALEGMTFGMSSSNKVTAFESSSFPIPIPAGIIDQVFKQTMLTTGSLNIASILEDFDLRQLGDISCSTNEEGIISYLEAKASHPIPISMNLGFVSFDIDVLNSGNLAKVEAEVLLTREGTLSFKNVVKIGRDSRLPMGTKMVFEEFVDRKVSRALFVSGFTFGGSKTHAFHLFKGISLVVPLPFDMIPLFTSWKDSLLGSSRITAPPSWRSLLPQISGANVTASNSGLSTSVDLSFNSFPFAMHLNIGYFSSGVYLSDTLIGSYGLTGFAAKGGGKQEMRIPVEFTFSQEDAVAESVAAIVNPAIINSKLPYMKTGFKDIRFGESADNPFDCFSLIGADFRVDLGTLLEEYGGNIPKMPDFNPAYLPINEISISDVAVVAQDEWMLLKLKALFPVFWFPLNIDFGYLSFDVSLFDMKFSTFVVDKFEIKAFGETQSLIFESRASLVHNNKLQQRVADVINPLLVGEESVVCGGDRGGRGRGGDNGGRGGGGFRDDISVGVKNIVFGSSADNPLSILRLIDVKGVVSVKTILGLMKSGQSDIVTYLTEIGLASMDIQSTPSGFNVATMVSFGSFPLPNFIFEVGLMTADISLKAGNETYILAKAGAMNLNVPDGEKELVIQSFVNIREVRDASAPKAVADVVSGVLMSGSIPSDVSISIGNIMFGKDAGHCFSLINKISLDVNVKEAVEYATSLVSAEVATLPSSPVSIMNAFPVEVNRVVGEFGTPGIVEIDLKLTLKFDFPVSFDLGYMAVDATVEGEKEFGSISLEGARYGLLNNSNFS
jgi:hypothetical protein